MKEVWIKEGNITLAGILHEATSDKILIICHGFRGSKEGGGRAVKLSNEVANMKIAVMRFDFTPLASLTRQVEEVGAVVDYCRQKLGIQNIYLLGRSMGGSAALAYAAQQGCIDGLCLWAAPWDLRETFQLALREDYDKLLQGQAVVIDAGEETILLRPDFIRDFANYRLLSAVGKLKKVPLLILHGDQDEVVPLKQAELMYQNAKHLKKLHVIEGGDHQLHEFYAETTKVILAWLHSIS